MRRKSQTSGLDRLPPHSLISERAVLGAILMDARNCMGEAVAALRNPLAFFDLRHQMLYRHLLDMFEHNRPIDLLTVAARVETADEGKNCGGLGYLSELSNDAVPMMIGSYLATVREKYLLRRYLQTFTEMSARIYDSEMTAVDLMDKIDGAVMDISRERVCSQDTEWRAVIEKAIDAMDHYQRGGAQLRGIATGFDYLDKMLCGLKPCEMIVLAGRPGMGKTAMAFNIVEHVAVTCGIPTGAFSLEMSGEELGSRSVFQHARADYQRFRTGYMQNEDFPKLMKSAHVISRAPIKLDESSGISILDIRAKARRWVAEDGIKLLVVDYAGLVSGTRNFRERRDEVGEVSRGIKATAKELKIPVLLLAQLNRELEKDKHRVPQLSDLRESGDLEQDADVVGILHAPKLTKDEQAVADEDRDWARHSYRVNLQICKQRNGPTGKVEFLFEKKCMRFSSYKRAKVQEKQEEL